MQFGSRFIEHGSRKKSRFDNLSPELFSAVTLLQLLQEYLVMKRNTSNKKNEKKIKVCLLIYELILVGVVIDGNLKPKLIFFMQGFGRSLCWALRLSRLKEHHG